MKISIFNNCLKIALIIGSAQFSSISFSHAGEWRGEISRQPSDVNTLCVELDKKESPYLQKICLDKISVKWKLKTTEQAPLVRSSISWKLQPTLWLRENGEDVEKRPLKSFSKTIQAAYQATTPTDITLAAFFYPETNSAPDDTASATDNLGIAIEFEADVLSKSGDGYSFNAPSSPDWGALLINAPEQVPCIISNMKKTRSYLPGDVSKEFLQKGMSLSGLTICQVLFTDIKNLNKAIQKTCTQCKSGVGPAIADKGISLDDLLTGVDEGTHVNPDDNAETALAASNTTSNSLDDILDGVEDDVARARQQQAQENVRQENVAANNRCLSQAAKIDVAVNKLISWMDKSGRRNRRNWKGGGNCDSIFEKVDENIDFISSAPSVYIPGNSPYGRLALYGDVIESCASKRENKLSEFKKNIQNIDLSGCQFDGPDPKDGTNSLVKIIEDENDNIERRADYAFKMDAQFKRAGRASLTAMSASFNRDILESFRNLGSEFSEASQFRELELKRYRSSTRKRKLRLPQNNTAAFSYPETTRRQNNSISIDNGPGTDYSHCMSIKSKGEQTRCLNQASGESMKRNRDANSSKSQSSGGSVKTQ